MKQLLGFIFALGWCLPVLAAEVIPPVPGAYFNDYAGAVPAGAAAELNQSLADFERATSNQVLVALFPKMQSDSSIEDYTVRVAQKWGVGQKDRKNGVVLFVFLQDRKMFIQVGYGLEGAMPDAVCKQIINNEIKPRFRNADYEGGLRAGISAIMAATRGEYKGKASDPKASGAWAFFGVIGFFLVIFVLNNVRRAQRGTVYGRHGQGSWSSSLLTGLLIGSVSNSRGRGGGSWGGGGGGFSGGGGSFGGGGAGGSWGGD